MGITVVWFKRDLRVRDHAALAFAAERGAVLPVYVYEDEVIRADDASALHLDFINEALADLERDLSLMGIPLLRLRGQVPGVLEELRRRVPFHVLASHEETGNALTYARDRRVASWAREHGVTWREFPQNGVVRRLRTRDGWASHWEEWMRQPVREAPGRLFGPEAGWGGIEVGVLGAESFGMMPLTGVDRQRGGRDAATACLDGFLAARGVNYRRDLSSPLSGESGCSRLSPHLAWGCLSMREVFQATERRVGELRAVPRGEVDPRWFGSLRSFSSRLRWHCHFMQKLEDEPGIEFRNFSRSLDGLREDEFREDRFEAWCAGQTGYPMVDACMRSLQGTGWLNFRMRAMLMSFAAYHMWLHWRRPAQFLARWFTDYEPGIHYSQCQMQSGTTGINTIRVYSPAKQQRDQDPDGAFIRRWVPELEGVPNALLGEPWKLEALEQRMYGCVLGRDYPFPVVDPVTAPREAKDRIFARRRERAARAEADRIQVRHGSRRRSEGDWR